MRADARKHPEESATSGGELTLGSPSFRTGMAAAREGGGVLKPPRSATRRRRFATPTKNFSPRWLDSAAITTDSTRRRRRRRWRSWRRAPSSSDETPRSRAKRRANVKKQVEGFLRRRGGVWRVRRRRGRLVRHRRRGHLHGRDGGVCRRRRHRRGCRVGVFRRVGGGVLRAKRRRPRARAPRRDGGARRRGRRRARRPRDGGRATRRGHGRDGNDEEWRRRRRRRGDVGIPDGGGDHRAHVSGDDRARVSGGASTRLVRRRREPRDRGNRPAATRGRAAQQGSVVRYRRRG